MRVAVIGAAGRMGCAIIEAIQQADGVSLGAAVERTGLGRDRLERRAQWTVDDLLAGLEDVGDDKLFVVTEGGAIPPSATHPSRSSIARRNTCISSKR